MNGLDWIEFDVFYSKKQLENSFEFEIITDAKTRIHFIAWINRQKSRL